MTFDLSVIIVNWNTAALLEGCLDAVLAAAGSLSVQVIVVDNGSTDGSVELLAARFPKVSVIRNATNMGFARANNQALALAEGRHILLLNSDTVINETALREMVAYVDACPAVGIVGPTLTRPDGSPQLSRDLFPLRPLTMAVQRVIDRIWSQNKLTRKGQMARWPSAEAHEVDWVPGAALMIRRQVVEQIGLLDERYRMYAEEMDWCYRAKQAGWKVVYLPQATVVHVGQGSSQTSSELRQRLARLRQTSLELFYAKHYGRPAAWALHLIHARQNAQRPSNDRSERGSL